MANYKNKSEKSLARIANDLYMQIKDSDTKLYRGFRVYHPVYRISVDINTEHADENYHIIEKYMDKLICGYTGDKKMTTDAIIIRDKDELFELLGIDQQAYEIAECFFQDLMLAGHFRVIPGQGIQGLKPAYESIKLNKRVTSAIVREKRLFDQFSGKLMPKVFDEELERFAREQESISDEPSVGLDPKPLSEAEINYLIGNYDYINTEQIERNLPQGFQSMSVSTDAPIDIVFYPYYLVIFKTGNNYDYKAYRVDNGKPIEWIGEQYKTAAYTDAIKRLDALSKKRDKQTFLPTKALQYQMTEDFEPLIDSGFSRDPDTGNYVWNLQEDQIEDMLGLGEDKIYKPVVSWIAERDILYMNNREAGKFVFIHKTKEQEELLLRASSVKSAEQRKKLFDEYLQKVRTGINDRQKGGDKSNAVKTFLNNANEKGTEHGNTGESDQKESIKTDHSDISPGKQIHETPTPGSNTLPKRQQNMGEHRKRINLKDATNTLLSETSDLLSTTVHLGDEADGLLDSLQHKAILLGQEKKMVIGDYGSNITVTQRRANVEKFIKCPFCSGMLSDDDSKTQCTECGASLVDLCEVEFTCNEKNGYGLTRSVNNWIRKSNVKMPLFLEIDGKSNADGDLFLSEVKLYYKPSDKEARKTMRFDIICDAVRINSDAERDDLISSWKKQHSYGSTTIHTISKPDNAGRKALTAAILYEINKTTLQKSAPQTNPELDRCPYCGKRLNEKSCSCYECGESFSNIEYVDFIQNDWDSSLLFDEVNSFISNTKINVLDIIDIETSSGTVSFSDNEKMRSSFVDRLRVYYVPLLKDRKYSCCYEQVAKYEISQSDNDAEELANDWFKPIKLKRYIVTSYAYRPENGEKHIDVFVLAFFDNPEANTVIGDQKTTDETPASNKNDSNPHAGTGKNEASQRVLTENDKARINKAILLYGQKKYMDAMETFVEFSQFDTECAFYLGLMYERGYGFPKDQEKANYWYTVSDELKKRQKSLH